MKAPPNTWVELTADAVLISASASSLIEFGVLLPRLTRLWLSFSR